MNQIDEKRLIEKAKQKYEKHKWLNIYVKKNAFLPYEKSFFHKIIADSKKPLHHKNYILYIHEDYLTISSNSFIFEPIKVTLHDKLWVELQCVFNLKSESEDITLSQDDDNEPI